MTEDSRPGRLPRGAQRKASEELSPALRQLAYRIASKLKNLGRAPVMTRWEIGHWMCEAESELRRYGKRVVELLAAEIRRMAAMGTVSANELYKDWQFAEQFTQHEVTKLLSRRTRSGRQITWTHLRSLLALGNGPEARPAREQILKRIFEEDLSTRQVTLLVQEFWGAAGSRGRARAQPKNAQSALQQVQRFQRAISARLPGWKRVFRAVAELPPERRDSALRNELRRAATACQKLEKQLHSLVEQIHAARR